MLDTLKPGQMIRCTIAKAPTAEAKVDTIERLMRMDPAVSRGLRKAHRRRQQDMVVYNRGNRDWYKREKCARIASCAKGEKWTMVFNFDIKRELNSVKNFVTIEAA
jgi:transposase InsO family protein